MARVSPALQTLARAASQAVSPALQNTRYNETIRDGISANYVRTLIRDGVVVWSAQGSGLLQLSGDNLILPGTATQTQISTADADTGVWVHRVTNASNSANYFESDVSVPSGGDPLTLSGDLDAGLVVSLNPILILGPYPPQIIVPPPPPVDGSWIQLLQDSMAVRSVTQRVQTSQGELIIGADGQPIPFPDSYAGVTSFAGMVAMLNGRPTGEADTNIQFFTQGVNTQGSWGWWGARQGHTATQSRLRISDMFLVILRESTRQWQIAYRGMRASGARWSSINNIGQWGFGEDLSSDPNATYVAPVGSFTHELWPKQNVSNPSGYVDFFGVVDRDLIADMRTWCIGARALVEGPDRANARFVGTIGIDHYRTDHAGRRYWASGYPKYVSDSGGAEWKDIRNDGQPQWVVGIGCFELSRSQQNRPPWGSYTGTWPFSSPPSFGPSWAEIVANPPPDMRT
jgi:hypothetical protein